jgi:hypothetical protein
MTDTVTGAAIAERMHHCAQLISGVEQSGRHAQGWTYATADDVYTTVREAMHTSGIAFACSTTGVQIHDWASSDGKPMRIAVASVQLSFTDTETGEAWSVNSEGEADATGAGAVTKAQADATKNGLLRVFLIPQHESTTPRPTTAKPATTSSNGKWVFPYGHAKGQTIGETETTQLEYYLANGFDPNDAQYGDKNQRVRTAIQAELLNRTSTAVDKLKNQLDAVEVTE